MLNNVYGNYATNNGGGSYLNSSINTTISGSVYGNSATISGGGLYLANSTYNTINGNVYSNSNSAASAWDGGGCIYLIQCITR
jgi:hypothetical protein